MTLLNLKPWAVRLECSFSSLLLALRLLPSLHLNQHRPKTIEGPLTCVEQKSLTIITLKASRRTEKEKPTSKSPLMIHDTTKSHLSTGTAVQQLLHTSDCGSCYLPFTNYDHYPSLYSSHESQVPATTSTLYSLQYPPVGINRIITFSLLLTHQPHKEE